MRVLAPAALVAIALTLTACSTPTQPTNGAFSVAIGDCFDLDEASAQVDSVPLIACTDAHNFEAYAGAIMETDTYPGEADTVAEADARCSAAFEPYVGVALTDAYEASTYDYTYFYPSEQSWAIGDREILCLVYATGADGTMVPSTTSLRGAGATG